MNIQDWSKEVVEQAQRNIGAFRTVNGKRRRISSSGALKESLGYLVIEKNGKISIAFKSKLFYAAFIQSGVNGTEINHGSIYSFKEGGKMIPTGNVKGGTSDETWGIRKWMREKPMRLRDKSGSYIKATEKAKRSAAFAIAISLKKKGIAPMPFMSEAIMDTMDKHGIPLADFIEDAMSNSLKKYKK